MRWRSEYVGQFVIAGATPSGIAYAVFSARDMVGNRGTDIDAGGQIRIDTIGPAGKPSDLTATGPDQNHCSGSRNRRGDNGPQRKGKNGPVAGIDVDTLRYGPLAINTAIKQDLDAVE